MIKNAILNRVRAGICGVGYLTVRLQEIDPIRPFFEVVGTGFLIRRNTVMTNRHVLEGIMQRQMKMGFPDKQKCLMFVYPTGSHMWLASYVPFGSSRFLTHEDLDIGFIKFDRSTHSGSRECRPLALGDLSRVAVSLPIAVCGYPHGTLMLHKEADGMAYRYGPVLQQGYVSTPLLRMIMLDLSRSFS